jgi:hypothetical protein
MKWNTYRWNWKTIKAQNALKAKQTTIKTMKTKIDRNKSEHTIDFWKRWHEFLGQEKEK